MAVDIQFADEAEAEMAKLPQAVQDEVDRRVVSLAADPTTARRLDRQSFVAGQYGTQYNIEIRYKFNDGETELTILGIDAFCY